MKVTISFNGTKIVVPCGDGEISVREVTTLAATRYKKAIGKTNAYWVSVASLKSHEGGILDQDDLIGDVCDDREQLAAIFNEQNGGHYHGSGGDGMSSASDSDTKENNFGTGGMMLQEQFFHTLLSITQVRRGSEPALHKNINSTASDLNAAAPVTTEHNLRSSLRKTMVNTTYSVPLDHQDRSNQQSSPDSQYEGDAGSLSVMRRREPLGASGNKPERPKSPKRTEVILPNQNEGEFYFDIAIPNEIGYLGIHVVPCDIDGRLIVQGIEPGGRIDRDGRLAVQDAIVAINGYPLKDTPFSKAQEIFHEAKDAKELRLRILRGGQFLSNSEDFQESKENQVDVKSNNNNTAKKSETPAAGTKITTAVHANNTRKIGKKLNISLRKGPLGLGFSLTTRDNALGDNTPIYIKNILPQGAAIEEGSLKPGDRLLEVNDKCVDGMSQSDVVTLLRNVPLDSSVNLLVSRHSSAADGSDVADGAALAAGKSPTKLKNSDANSGITSSEQGGGGPLVSSMPSMTSSASPGISSDNYDEGGTSAGESEFAVPWKEREILTFDIPVHDSERAGLGVSVKGKTSTGKESGVIDLGIFVKSVLHGGAASKDGRLMTNDQLININGSSLLGKANPAAMETLRKAMHEEGPVPGIISLTVARRKEPSLNPASDNQPQDQPPNLNRRDSMSSLPTSSDDEMVREYHVSAPSPFQNNQFKVPSTSSLMGTRNPVIDRLMGKDASTSLVPSNLRNESYYMATDHETWNGTMLQQHMFPNDQDQKDFNQMPSPNRSPDSVFIEQPTTNPYSNDTDMPDDSLTSLVEIVPSAFARDQFGRQSMSEKRHATLDAKSTDTYQKRKKAREEREKQKNQLQHWKKSASLESLHQMSGGGQLKNYENQSPYQRANSVRVSRNRGCNESFRAAVDRSYEKDFPEVGPSSDFAVDKVVMRRSKSSQSEERKKNRNSKLLRGLGTMFKIGGSGDKSNSNSIERTKDTKVLRNEAALYQQHLKLHPQQYIPQPYPHAGHPPQIPQARSHSQPRYHPMRTTPNNEMYEYMPSAMMRPGSRVGIADPTSSESPDYDVL
eukprot:04367.XXX_109905_102637_1 [CDS] Oithona nana genome sequencing.